MSSSTSEAQKAWDFVAASQHALENARLKKALEKATGRFDEGRKSAFDSLPDGELLRQKASEIKDECLADLGGYLEEFARNIEAAGGKVHWAKDGKDACEIISKIARDSGVEKIVKSKSMATEEIHLNDALEADGFKVVETDFGEYILQLSNDSPSHIVLPAVHRSKEDIAETFSEAFGKHFDSDPDQLAKEARIRLRDEFIHAQMGITGVNVACADTGTILQVTNEGNGRLTTTWPKIHIALMGMEKLIARFEDVPVFLKLLARSATGQKSTVYTNLTTGNRRDGELDGSVESHIVIMDNGRSEILAGKYRDTLRCIRCGACLNICPVYRQVGGHAYGSVYPGPIGSLLTPLFEGQEKFKELPQASSLCGACYTACPVKIDIPSMLVELRADQVDSGIMAWHERLVFRLWTFGLGSRFGYRFGAGVSRLLMSFMARGGWINSLPGPMSGWTKNRDFPSMAPKPFHARWQDLSADDISTGEMSDNE